MIKVNDVIFEGNQFPNGETIFKITDGMVTKTDVVITLIWESNDDLFNLMILKKYFDEQRAVYPNRNDCTPLPRRIILDCPFMPYGQADREIMLTPNGDCYTCTFKYFAQLLNDLKFDRINIKDPHSPIMAATLKNCRVTYPVINWYKDNFTKFDVIFFPDNGAQKKYTEIFESNISREKMLPYTFAYKKRNLETGEIISLNVMDPELIKDKRVIIIDDLVMGGGTYKYSANELYKLGAKSVDCYFTHLMPQSKQFVTKESKEFGILNIYAEDTLQLRNRWAIEKAIARR